MRNSDRLIEIGDGIQFICESKKTDLALNRQVHTYIQTYEGQNSCDICRNRQLLLFSGRRHFVQIFSRCPRRNLVRSFLLTLRIWRVWKFTSRFGFVDDVLFENRFLKMFVVYFYIIITIEILYISLLVQSF